MYISDYEAEQYSFGEKNWQMRVLELCMLVLLIVLAVWYYLQKTKPYIPPAIVDNFDYGDFEDEIQETDLDRFEDDDDDDDDDFVDTFDYGDLDDD